MINTICTKIYVDVCVDSLKSICNLVTTNEYTGTTLPQKLGFISLVVGKIEHGNRH